MTPSFSSPPVVVGLDIGTTKICALVASEGEDTAGASAPESGSPDGQLQILGVGIVPSGGVRRGVVVDVPDTIEAIKEAITRAAHMAGVEIEGVVAGVTGDHVISENRTGSVTVASRGNQVSHFDVDRAMAAALLEIGRDREIIHSLPRTFAVDEERSIKNPLGMVGTRLEVETHVVTGQSAVIRNTLSCLSGAGVRADGLVLEPIATAEAVTTRAEREMGALVLDIGGGTTDLAAYFDGSIIYSAALPVGGNHVTRDLSIGLSTPFEFAEKLKVGSGAATRDMIPHGEALEVLTAGGGSRLRIPRALLGEIIEARMRELFELSLSMAMTGNLQGRVPGGIILSGGGALLPGSVELASKIFGLPARLGVPEDLSGWSEPVSSPQFSTAVGLCRFALAQKRQLRQRSAPMSLPHMRRVWAQLAPGVTMARPLTPTPTPVAEPTNKKPQTTPTPTTQSREEFPAQMRFSATPAKSSPSNAPRAEVPPQQPQTPQQSAVQPAPAKTKESAPTPVKPTATDTPATAQSQAAPAEVKTEKAAPTVPATLAAPPATTPAATMETAKAAEAPTPTPPSIPQVDDSKLAAQRAKLREMLPHIDATRADMSRARDAQSPGEGSQSPPQSSWWNRFLRFIGFDEDN